MRKPLMDSDPTRGAHEGTAPASLEVTPTTDVEVASKALAAAGAVAAVVLEDGRPVGVVTAAALQASAAGRPVVEVMDYDVVEVPPTADGSETLALFTRAAWASLFRRKPFRQRLAA